MTGGGMFVLVTYGTQNVILSGNPQMTYYYKIFKRYSHFSMENVSIALEGASYPTSGTNTVQLRTKLQRVGDLLSDMIFSFDLPDIYSRAVSARTTGGTGTRAYDYNFQWVKAVGAAIINSAEFFIGGQSIQRIDGTYLYAKAQLEYDTATLDKWNIMVGNTPELTAPQTGAYAASSGAATTYPTVITQPATFDVEFVGETAADTAVLVVTSITPPGFIFTGMKFKYIGYDSGEYTNTISKVIGNTYYLLTPARIPQQVIKTTVTQGASRPSIFAQTIHVPLNFWFTDATSQALPLVALQNQECEVVITLNPIRRLYTILDPEGFRVESQSITVSNLNNNPIYTDTLQVNNFQTFLLDQTATLLNINPRVQCTFVYLSDDERTTFATRPLTYVLPQIRMTPLSSAYQFPVSVVTEKLEMSSVFTRFIFVTRRTDWDRRNDFTNFTNWSTYPAAPWDPGALDETKKKLASGLVVPNSQRDIIRGLRILCNGNEIQEQKPYDFLTKIYPFRYTTGSANAEIPIYTWALTSSKIQPSGSINSSRVTKFDVEISFNPLFLGANYGYNVDLYVETLNFLVIASGSGAPKYVL